MLNLCGPIFKQKQLVDYRHQDKNLWLTADFCRTPTDLRQDFDHKDETVTVSTWAPRWMPAPQGRRATLRAEARL